MQVFIKTLTGKTFTITVGSVSECVQNLRLRIETAESYPPDQQRLVYVGKQMEDGQLLSDYGIHKECTIHIILRLKGC